MFLLAAGVEPPPILYSKLDEEYGDQTVASVDQQPVNAEIAGEEQVDAANHQQAQPGHQEDNAIVISSDDEDELNAKRQADIKPDLVESGPFEDETNDNLDESKFGYVVDLAFLRDARSASSAPLDDKNDDKLDRTASQRSRRKRPRHQVDKNHRHESWHPRRGGDDDPEEHGKVRNNHNDDDDNRVDMSEKRKRGESPAFMPDKVMSQAD